MAIEKIMNIKFRAWQKDKQIMRGVLDINFEGYQNALRNIRYDNGKRETNLNNFILLRFTNVLDKNGREIFEGDLLQLTSNLQQPSIVHVQFDDENGGWHRFKDYRYGEIIGNIYEKPELKTNIL